MNNTIKIITTLLGLVVLVELIVLYLFKNNLNIKISRKTDVSPTATISLNPNDPVFALRHDLDQAIDVSMLYTLSFVKKGVLQSSILNNVFEGTLTNVSKNGGSHVKNNLKYDYDFGVMIQNKGTTNEFYFQNKDINKVKVYKQSSTEAGEFTSLNTGDTVRMEYIVDMMKRWDDNIVEVTFTVL